MSVTEASSPGKIILFGEHAVVYGRPAIAAPVTNVRARAKVEDFASEDVHLVAPNLGREYLLKDAPENDPFARAVHVAINEAGRSGISHLKITINSSLPISSGLGSGAAMAAAVIRALLIHLSVPELATNERISALTYLVEKLLHGTPSGIDNTVVSFEKPVYFVRKPPENLIETLDVPAPIRFVVADTGQASSTKDVVGDVRNRWQEKTAYFENLFDGCGQIAESAREVIEQGMLSQLGNLMVENQVILREMTVSSSELEKLISAALSAGALGAKLSGAGRGGNMIALVEERSENRVKEALLTAGARSVLTSVLTQESGYPSTKQ